jgi:hypothetical protein
VAVVEPVKEKEKKKLVAPEDKAKQNMAKSLFGGMKGPAKQPVGPKTNQPGPAPKKKTEKVETADLI